MKLQRLLIAAVTLTALSPAHAGFTLNDLVKRTTGVDVLARLNASKAEKYPEFANGVELLVMPQTDGSGVSRYLRDGLRAKYPDNDDAVQAGSNAFKVRAEMLEVVRNNGKLTDPQLKKSAAAEECATRVLAGAIHVDASEGFEWESEVWNVAFPAEMIVANANLKAANDNHTELENSFGQQFEARKKKMARLPASLRQVCAMAGVTMSAMAPLTRDEQVERDGSPSLLGIEHAMHRILDGGNSAISTSVLSVEKLGCSRDGSAYLCDVSAHIRSLVFSPTLVGVKPSPPGEIRKNVVDNYRLVWSNQSNEWLPITR